MSSKERSILEQYANWHSPSSLKNVDNDCSGCGSCSAGAGCGGVGGGCSQCSGCGFAFYPGGEGPSGARKNSKEK